MRINVQRMASRFIILSLLLCLCRKRVFRRMDDDGNRSLNFEEFRKGMDESGVKVNDELCRALFAAFDTDQSGSVCINEFLKAIRVGKNQCLL